MFENALAGLEGEIEAYDLGQQTLADEIAELENDERVDEELERLKAKMGNSAPKVVETPKAENKQNGTE